jgi:signal transduction histidine kinase
MPDALHRLLRGADRWLDGALGAALASLCVAELTLAPPRATALTFEVGAVGMFGAVAVAMRRRRPLALSLAFSAACFFPGLVIGSRWWNAPSASALLTVIILAYTVGAQVGGAPAAIGLVVLCVGSSGGDFSDPIVLSVFTVPAWVAGTTMRSRSVLAAQLTERARELTQEREAYAREAVRYERARIARDLHDIVAHNLSMIVVQAGAGRRALASHPATAAESLRHIEGGAAQAEREITQLVNLLGDRIPAATQRGLPALSELLARAGAAGLAVDYVFSGDNHAVSPKLASVAFHVTQEGITNALKHAPGAPIRVAVDAADGCLSVVVENGPPCEGPSGLEQAGGGHGIAGLRERVAAVGGDLHAAPTLDGGWRIAGEMPTSRASPADTR